MDVDRGRGTGKMLTSARVKFLCRPCWAIERKSLLHIALWVRFRPIWAWIETGVVINLTGNRLFTAALHKKLKRLHNCQRVEKMGLVKQFFMQCDEEDQERIKENGGVQCLRCEYYFNPEEDGSKNLELCEFCYRKFQAE